VTDTALYLLVGGPAGGMTVRAAWPPPAKIFMVERKPRAAVFVHTYEQQPWSNAIGQTEVRFTHTEGCACCQHQPRHAKEEGS
jgi:hypothetical protein